MSKCNSLLTGSTNRSYGFNECPSTPSGRITCGSRRVLHRDLHGLTLPGLKRKCKSRKGVNSPTGSIRQKVEIRRQSLTLQGGPKRPWTYSDLFRHLWSHCNATASVLALSGPWQPNTLRGPPSRPSPGRDDTACQSQTFIPTGQPNEKLVLNPVILSPVKQIQTV